MWSVGRGGGDCRGNRGSEAKHCTRNRFPGYRLRTNKPGDEKINESPLFSPKGGGGASPKNAPFSAFLAAGLAHLSKAPIPLASSPLASKRAKAG